MGNRRIFLKHALVALAISLVPKVLQPVLPEQVEIVEQEIPVTYMEHRYDAEKKVWVLTGSRTVIQKVKRINA